MQAGNIYKHGKWWVLRYRETVIENGEEKRVRVVKRLALIDDPKVEEARKQRRESAYLKGLAAEWLAPLNAGAAPESVDTVGRFLDQVFLPYCRQQHKPSTASSYAELFRLIRLHDAFCRLRLRQVRTADVHDLLEAIAREKKFSHSRMSNIRNFLSAGFKYAKNKGLVANNPVRDVITPKGAPAKETYAYTIDEIHAMLAVLEEPVRTLVLTAALTGLRRSELQGLKWDDFTGDTLRVGRAVWHGIETETKTIASKATVPLLPILAQALKVHKEQNGYNAWVFHGRTGKPIWLDHLSKRTIRPTLAKAGIEWHGWHAFRRGLATNLYELGATDKTAQAILRHADISTTMNFYVKARPDTAQAAMAKLGAAFQKSAKRARLA